MSEQIIDPTEQVIEPGASDEVHRLRTTNTELLKTAKARKSRIETLETEATELKAKLTAADSRVHEITVAGPLRTMAQSLSKAPSAFLDVFAKSYRVELQDGTLTLLHAADGKPVLAKDDKPVPFTREALLELLMASEGAAGEFYKATMIVGHASGGAGRVTKQLPMRPSAVVDDLENKAPALTFGLR